jgi:hypothetical protein
MEHYTWVVRQIGKRGAWEPYQLANLPYPPAVDDKVTMQRFASAACQTGDIHKGSFVLDFDAHADWLTLEICLDEVRRFLSAFSARWSVAPESFSIAFSGRAGFHVTIPVTMLGDVASPHLTTAYKAWATAIKDALALVTLDAPSHQEPTWWYRHIERTVGYLPAAVQDAAAFALALRRVGIYSRRRMIRREGSQHPGSGLFKIPVLPHELTQGAAAIRALAELPRIRPAALAPPPHAGLAAHLRQLLMEITAQEQRPQDIHTYHGDRRVGPALRDVLPVQTTGADAPLCIQRILAHPAPDGSSNLPLINLLSYWRTTGVSETDATERAAGWLLRGVTDPVKRNERWDSARSVGRAVYAHNYRFAHDFVKRLGLVTDDECATCSLRAACWSTAP